MKGWLIYFLFMLALAVGPALAQPQHHPQPAPHERHDGGDRDQYSHHGYGDYDHDHWRPAWRHDWDEHYPGGYWRGDDHDRCWRWIPIVGWTNRCY